MAFTHSPAAGQQSRSAPAYGPGFQQQPYGPTLPMQAPAMRPPPLSFQQLEEYGNVPYVTTRDRYTMSRDKPRVITPPGVDSVDFAKDLKNFREDTSSSIRNRKSMQRDQITNFRQRQQMQQLQGPAGHQGWSAPPPAQSQAYQGQEQQHQQPQYPLEKETLLSPKEEEERGKRAGERDGKCLVS